MWKQFVWLAGPVALLVAVSIGSGQQKVPFDKGIPVAPEGLAHRPLPKLPMEFDTGEGQRIRVVAVARGIESPFGAAFLPDGGMLVTTRTGQVRIIRNGVLDPKPIAGTPASYWAVESGLPGAVHGYMDIALHPQFAQNQFVYLTYTKPLDAQKRTVALARGKWSGSAITDMRDIFVGDQAATSRIAFGRDGMLYMSMTGNEPQDANPLGGKVLRLRDDGTVPPDNPFVGQAGKRPEIYTMGHRGTLGLAMH